MFISDLDMYSFARDALLGKCIMYSWDVLVTFSIMIQDCPEVECLSLVCCPLFCVLISNSVILPMWSTLVSKSWFSP